MAAVDELVGMTATEMVHAVRSKLVSRREIVQAHLDRIERVNGSVNALVELRADAALADAQAADRDWRNRSSMSLDGVPVSIKDHFDVAGMKHTEGVRAFSERRSPGDSLPVERLKNGGAIVIGKGNQPEFQIRWNTLNDLYGPTRNPRNLALTAGGSTGGDAAAVAAGMAAIGLGMDSGGSIRYPAACCRIYGLRPSPGRVANVDVIEPLDGPPTLEFMLTGGPVARSVGDLVLAFGAVAGPDPRDPWSLPVPFDAPDASNPCRVARMLRQTGGPVEPEVEAAVDEAARALTDAGYEVVDVAIPGGGRVPELWGQLRQTETWNLAWHQWEPLLSEIARWHIRTLIETWNPGRDVQTYATALTERRALTRQVAEWMEDYPLVLAPVSGMPTPRLEFDHYLTVDQMRRLFDYQRNLVWANCLGLPAVALPTGVQIIARRFRDDEAMAAAAAVERAIGPCSIADPSTQSAG